MEKFCRLCLERIPKEMLFFQLDGPDASCIAFLIKSQLHTCIPEMKVDIIKNPIVCHSCLNSLTSAYKFKCKCIDTEKELVNYILQENIRTAYVDINLLVKSRNSSRIAHSQPKIEVKHQTRKYQEASPKTKSQVHDKTLSTLMTSNVKVVGAFSNCISAENIRMPVINGIKKKESNQFSVEAILNNCIDINDSDEESSIAKNKVDDDVDIVKVVNNRPLKVKDTTISECFIKPKVRKMETTPNLEKKSVINISSCVNKKLTKSRNSGRIKTTNKKNSEKNHSGIKNLSPPKTNTKMAMKIMNLFSRNTVKEHFDDDSTIMKPPDEPLQKLTKSSSSGIIKTTNKKNSEKNHSSIKNLSPPKTNTKMAMEIMNLFSRNTVKEHLDEDSTIIKPPDDPLSPMDSYDSLIIKEEEVIIKDEYAEVDSQNYDNEEATIFSENWMGHDESLGSVTHFAEELGYGEAKKSRYSCTVCNYSCNNEIVLEAHTETHHNKD